MLVRCESTTVSAVPYVWRAVLTPFAVVSILSFSLLFLFQVYSALGFGFVLDLGELILDLLVLVKHFFEVDRLLLLYKDIILVDEQWAKDPVV